MPGIGLGARRVPFGVAARVQVLWQAVSRGVLRPGQRDEPGDEEAVRGQPADEYAAVEVLPQARQHAGRDPCAQRHPGGDGGTEEPHDRPDLAARGDAVQELSLIHISEPTRLRRISYAVFCLKKKKKLKIPTLK